MSENENEYLINMEGNLVNKELIDINDENFKKVMFLYSSALKEIKTKMEILQDELRIFSNYEPIEYITTRLKKPETIIENLLLFLLTYIHLF